MAEAHKPGRPTDGPECPRSTVLSADEETLIVAFRRHTLLPLDDCLYALQATIPHLTRSSLHRLFQRHGISRLPTAEGTKLRQRFRSYPLGYVHIDLAEVWTRRASCISSWRSIASASLPSRNYTNARRRRIAADFLRRLIERVPYRIHTVLTDNGFQFTPPHGGWSVGEIQQHAGESSALSRPCL